MNLHRREARQQLGAVRYEGRRTWCARREQSAVISVVERGDAGRPLCFVRWCSLRGLGACDERCLAATCAPPRPV